MFTIFRSDGPDKQLGTVIENIIRYQRKYTNNILLFSFSRKPENQPYMSDVLLVSSTSVGGKKVM